ncbi:MAG TPA: SHOCT domain-containing protein [Methanosarcina sp.]|nr:SHOCT domain-containing protein [Methanosarcina sp.]
MEVVKMVGFGMMGNYGYGMMGSGGIFFGLLFWIIIIVLAYFLIKSLIEQNKTRRGDGKSALDIAKERYAKGEITKEEFEEIKGRLM